MFTRETIEKYFFAEKNGGLILIIIGLMAVVTAIIFLIHFKIQWYKGFAIPILIFGIIHFFAGYRIYKTCDDARKRIVYAYDMNRDEIKNNEISRVDKMIKNLMMFRYFGIAILLIGVALYFYYRSNINKGFWVAFGLALALEAVISLGFIFFADKRVNYYLNGMHSFIEKTK